MPSQELLFYLVIFAVVLLLKMKREGAKIINQTENVLKEITVHVISVLVVDYCLQSLFVYCCQLTGV